jgi:hypothetical protein
MSKKLVAVVASLFVVIVGLAVWAFSLLGERNAMSTSLAQTRAELGSVTEELKQSEIALSDANAAVEQGRQDLSNTRQQLESTVTELSASKTTLASVRTRLETAQSEAGTLQRQVSAVQSELGIAKDTLKGLGITVAATASCTDAKLVDGQSAANPTYASLMAFLASDYTEQHTYILGQYDCSEFSRDIHNGAEAAGIRSAVVHVLFEKETVGHAFNAFLTSDYGMVYVDCTSIPDKIVRCRKGKEYRGASAYDVKPVNLRNENYWDGLMSYYYMPASSGGHAVVSAIMIYW